MRLTNEPGAYSSCETSSLALESIPPRVSRFPERWTCVRTLRMSKLSRDAKRNHPTGVLVETSNNGQSYLMRVSMSVIAVARMAR